MMGKTKKGWKFPHRTEIVQASAQSATELCSSTSMNCEQLDLDNEMECNGRKSVTLLPDSSDSELETRNEADKKDRKTQISSPTASLSMTMTCAYCTYECPSNRYNDMKKHLVRRHPEMFFMSELNSSVSSWKNDHFKDILMKIVFPKFTLTNETSSWCSCSVCDKKRSKVKRCLQLRVHLINEHLQEVREYLKTIMTESDASLREKLDNLSQSTMTDKVECNGKKPVPLEELKSESENEQVNIIADKKKRKTRDSTKTVEIVPTSAVALPASPSTPSNMVTTNKKVKMTATSPKISPSSPSKKDKPFCEYCNQTFTRHKDARRHWKYTCPNGERIPRPKKDTTSTNNLLTCDYCSQVCTSRQADMKKHLVRRHPEIFFESEISLNMNSEDLKNILMDRVFPKFNATATATDEDSSCCSCSVCGKQYSKYRRCLQLRLHLIDDHIEELRECLNDIMGQADADTTVQEQLVNNERKPAKTGRKKGYVKVECNGKEPVPPEKLESEPDTGGELVRIVACKRKRKTREIKVNFTASLSPSKKKVKITPTSSKISASPSPPSTPFCEFCNKTFTRVSDARRHWKYTCPNGEKMKIPTPTSASRLTCAYCSHECASPPYYMKRHLVRCHLETFFSTERNSSSLTHWKNENFKEIVMEIVIPKFALSEEGTFTSCSICLKKYVGHKSLKNNRYELIRHLIDDHMQEVRNYLKDILEESDASLEEKLENIRAQSISCESCSKSFTRLRDAQRHRKYFCGKGESSILTCAYCSHECTNRPDYMKRHLVRSHPEMFFESEKNNSTLSPWKYEHFGMLVKEIAIPKFICRDGTFASCSICCKKYSDKTFFKNNLFELTKHLINDHIQEVREHLKDILDQSDAYLQEQLPLDKDNDAKVQNCKSNLSESDEEDENNDEMEVETFMKVDESCVKDEDEYILPHDIDLLRMDSE